MRRIFKEYFEDLCNIDTQEQLVVHICCFDGIRGCNYFGREPIGKAEVEVRVRKLKNGKAAGGDEITGEMIKGGGDRVVDWIWMLCNIVFESGVVIEDWRSALIVHCTRVKGKEMNVKIITVLAC